MKTFRFETDYVGDPMTARELISEFLRMGGKEVFDPKQVSGRKINYIVVNGDIVITIGEGEPERLKGLMKGSSLKKHNKAFIVAATQAWTGKENRYFFMSQADSKESKRIEEVLKKFAGGDFIYPGQNFDKLPSIARFLWEKLSISPDDRLSAVMELVISDGDALYSAWKHPEFGSKLKPLIKGYFKDPKS